MASLVLASLGQTWIRAVVCLRCVARVWVFFVVRRHARAQRACVVGSLAAAQQAVMRRGSIDAAQWRPEAYAGAGCQLNRADVTTLSSATWHAILSASHPTVLTNEPGCSAAAEAVRRGEWSDEALATIVDHQAIVSVGGSSNTSSSFFPGPMSPEAPDHRGRMSLHAFLREYRASARARNLYLQSTIVPTLEAKLPRPASLEQLARGRKLQLQRERCRFRMATGSAAPPKTWTLKGEYAGSWRDVSSAWCGRLWLGRSDGTQESHLHFDRAENLACVVEGTKLYTLLPPNASAYVRGAADGGSAPNFSPLHVHAAPHEQPHPVPPAFYDAQRRCVVAPGEMLYLPSSWWHNVVTLAGRNVAVNWWYEALDREHDAAHDEL